MICLGYEEDRELYMRIRRAIRTMRAAGFNDEVIATNLNIKVEELDNYNDKWSIKKYGNKIVEMYKSGMTGIQIAEEIGYTSSIVCRYLKDEHPDIYKSNDSEVPKSLRKMMIKWVKEGKTLQEISELTGYPKKRIYPFVRELVRQHPPGWNDRLPQEKRDKIIEMYVQQGIGAAEIARIMEVNYSAVWRLLNRTGNLKLKKDKNSQKEQTKQQVGETKL